MAHGSAARLYILPCQSVWCLLGSLVYILSPRNYGLLDVFVLPALHLIGDMERAFWQLGDILSFCVYILFFVTFDSVILGLYKLCTIIHV